MSELPPGRKLTKILRPFGLFHMLDNWSCWKRECDFKYGKRTAGSNVFVDRQDVEVYDILHTYENGNMHTAFHPKCLTL